MAEIAAVDGSKVCGSNAYLMDIEEAGLVEVDKPALGAAFTSSVNVSMTEQGWKWAHFVRRWKADGKSFGALTSAHICRADEDTVNQVVRSLVDGDTKLDTVLYQLGITEVSEDLYRGLLRAAAPAIADCVECGTWKPLPDLSDGLCDDCYNDLVMTVDDEEEEWEIDDLVDELP
jgi:hypothetical protein